MKLQYDSTADAASVEVDGPTTPGRTAYTEELDQDRIVDFDADERVIQYEFLNVRRLGVRLDDLTHRDQLARLFAEAGFRERTWSTPSPAPQGQGRQ